MAHAEHITETIVHHIGITLNLSYDEAETLYIVTRLISGSHAGRRGDMTNIQEALRKIGIHATKDSRGYEFVRHHCNRSNSDISFKEERLPL